MSRSPIRAGGRHAFHNQFSSPSIAVTSAASQNRPRDAAKRNILGMWDTSQNTTNAADTIDGANPHHVQSLIEDLEEHKRKEIDLLRTDLLRATHEQQGTHIANMLKLSRAVKGMKIRDFNAKYECNLLQLLLQKDGVQVAGHKRPLPANNKPLPPVAATPAPTRRYGNVAPGSILRTARRGEVLYSQNGSPVEPRDVGALVATVAKKHKGNNNQTSPTNYEGANFEINIGDGQVVRLNDTDGIQQLGPSLKATAASQLQVLQDQMATLMAQLQK